MSPDLLTVVRGRALELLNASWSAPAYPATIWSLAGPGRSCKYRTTLASTLFDISQGWGAGFVEAEKAGIRLSSAGVFF